MSQEDWEYAVWLHLLPAISNPAKDRYRPSDNPHWPPPPERQDSRPLQTLVDDLPIPERARELVWALITGNVEKSITHRQQTRTDDERAAILSVYDGAVWKQVGRKDRLPTAAERREALFHAACHPDVLRVLSRGFKEDPDEVDPAEIEALLEDLVKKRKDVVEDPRK